LLAVFTWGLLAVVHALAGCWPPLCCTLLAAARCWLPPGLAGRHTLLVALDIGGGGHGNRRVN
jgi:hypothetical protein